MFRILCQSVMLPVVVLIFASYAAGQMTISGEVIDVIDGKTVLVATPGGKVKVELQYIDVPEQGQQLSETVKEHLRQLVVGKTIEYRAKTLFKDRAIGRLSVKNIDISQQMLRDGAAWHTPMPGSGQDKNQFELYAATEAAAKQDKIGVWSVPDLRPSWELRAEKKPVEKAKQNPFAARAYASAEDTASTRKKLAAPRNPAFGDVGSLLNMYDAVSKTGLLSTSFLPIQPDKSHPDLERAALDVTYYYKERENKKRTGSFVVTVVFESRKPQFRSGVNLTLLENDKTIVVGKPKRTVSYQGDYVRETLICEISRPMLERLTINDGIMLKMGQHMIYLVGTRYLLYNMLQVTQ